MVERFLTDVVFTLQYVGYGVVGGIVFWALEYSVGWVWRRVGRHR